MPLAISALKLVASSFEQKQKLDAALELFELYDIILYIAMTKSTSLAWVIVAPSIFVINFKQFLNITCVVWYQIMLILSLTKM